MFSFSLPIKYVRIEGSSKESQTNAFDFQHYTLKWAFPDDSIKVLFQSPTVSSAIDNLCISLCVFEKMRIIKIMEDFISVVKEHINTLATFHKQLDAHLIFMGLYS